MIGLPKNYSIAKTQITQEPENHSMGEQIIYPYPLLNQIVKGEEINERMRDAIYVSGIRVDFTFRNVGSRKLVFNYAVIHPKTALTVTNLVQEFFRDYTDERAWAANATDKRGLDWAKAVVNQDRYNIIAKGRMVLGPSGTTDVNVNAYNMVCEKQRGFWIPIRRMITYYETGGVSTCNHPVYFVCWCSNPHQTSGYNLTGSHAFRMRSIVWYRDPKNS